MIVINILVLAAFLILLCISRNYEKELVSTLDEKQHRLKQLYPLGLFLMDKAPILKGIMKNKKNSDNLEEPLRALYVGEQVGIVKRLYVCNKSSIVLLILLASDILSLVSSYQNYNSSQLFGGRYIERPGYNEGEKSVDLHVAVSDDSNMVLDEDIQVDVDEKRYEGKELDEKFQEAKKYIDTHLLNKNDSAEYVISDLDFVKKIPETGMTVKWVTENPKLIDEKGKIYNENLKEGVLTWVTAKIIYYDRTEEYTSYVKIQPKVYTQEEIIRNKLTEVINSLNLDSLTQDKVALPETIEDLHISWKEEKQNTGEVFLLLGIITAIILYFAMDRDLNSKVEKRNREMLLDYTEIINKFTLLVGAGMSLSNAWCKIARDYKEKGVKKRYAYEEMVITYGELMIGTSEVTAYERFGRRVKLLPYMRFSSFIAQNVKKGSTGLLNQLELEAKEAFEDRKELAKRLGEEAGTKLLLPMMIMLVLVLAIIMVPAFLSF